MRRHFHATLRSRPAAPQRGSVLLVVLIACAAAFGVWRMGLLDGLIGDPEEVAIDGAPVRKGDLRISEVVRGNLEATDSITLKCEVEGRSTIIYLAEEGSMMEEGDLVAELDVSQAEDELVRQEIEVKTAEASFTKAREQYDIQLIQNESDIAAAELAFELAQLDLEKYTGGSKDGDGDRSEDGDGGEWDNELLVAQEAVVLGESDVAAATKDLKWSGDLFKEEFITENEFESSKIAKALADIRLARSKRDLALIIKYGNRRKLAELQADVDTRGRDITKTEKQALARLADFLAARESALYKLDREKQQLTELREQIGKSKIYAPERGLLVYAVERSRWGNGDTIAEGEEVRERQAIATIPREGGMTVKASIHETKLKKITTGLPCIVTVDAFPDRTFGGRVDFVAVMADSGSWRSNPNQRLYKADISLLETTLEMRPGMSCNVEILVEDLVDVHFIPRQCVFLDGGETIVFVREGGDVVRRVVEVGLDNNKWVSIDKGLVEGEIVLLAPPADFEPAPVPEAERPSSAAPKGQSPGRGDSMRGGSKEGRTGGGRPSGAMADGMAARKQGAGDQRGGAAGGRPKGEMTDEQRAEWAKKMRDRGGSAASGGDRSGKRSGRSSSNRGAGQ